MNSDSSIPLSVPMLNGREWAYLKDCLDTNWVSSVGPYVDRFESAVAELIGLKFAVATCNGTSALHTALLVTGVKPGDEVLVSDLTFIAPMNAVRYAGAIPVTMDADPNSAQMDPDVLKAWLLDHAEPYGQGIRNRKTGRPIKAIIPVHILGHMAPIVEISLLAETYGLTVIEDASESIGACLNGKPAGALGHIGCFSFNGNKTITCGGGGMLVTRNGDWAERARYLTTQACDDKLEYIHEHIGYNYRLTNIQAALGLAQLEQLPAFLETKRRIAETYRSAFDPIPGVDLISPLSGCRSSWWLSTIRVDEAVFGLSSRELLTHLAERNIQARPLWQPMHLSPAHRDVCSTSCPVSETLYAQCLSLPSSSGLSKADQERIIEAVLSAGHSAS